MPTARNGSKILVGVRGTPADQSALSWAVAEAAARDAALVAVHAWHIPPVAYSSPGYAPIDRNEIEKEGQRALESALRETPGASRVSVEAKVAEGPAQVVLGDLAADPTVGLVVVGTRGRGTATGMLLGSVSHALSHDCPKPLAIVPVRKVSATAEPLVRHIVVGVDGSAGAEVALRWAAAEARTHHARLEAVTAWSWASHVFPAELPEPREGISDSRSLAAAFRQAAQATLRKALDGVGMEGLEVELSAREGRPADVLFDQAKTADLLVVGRRGLGRGRELFLGSVSHACANRPHVPVAIIPHG